VHTAVVDSCVFGTPWCIRYQISGSFPGLKELNCICQGGHEHLSALHFRVKSNPAFVSGRLWPAFTNRISELYSPLKTFVVGKSVKHLAGLLGDDNGASVMQLLDSAGFVASAGRSNATSADHISACVQPTRRVAPMLVPEGLGPSAHLAVALSLQHPFLRSPASSELEQDTLTRHHSSPGDLLSFRLKAVKILALLSDALKCEYAFWLPRVNKTFARSLHGGTSPFVEKFL
jgi:hypothetical protein